MSLITEASHCLWMCVCVRVCACAGHYVSRSQIQFSWAISSQESTQHETCQHFPLPWHWYTCRPFFQRHPSPFSNIKDAFEQAIRTEGEPFMSFVEHGRGPGWLKAMDAPGRCTSRARTRKYIRINTHAIFLLTLQRDCNITGKITQQMSLFVYLHTLYSLCAKCKYNQPAKFNVHPPPPWLPPHPSFSSWSCMNTPNRANKGNKTRQCLCDFVGCVGPWVGRCIRPARV